MLVYQTLDNMDGKQARKTKSSSPLGLLFDHGCDAMNSILGSANWIAAMGLVPGAVEYLKDVSTIDIDTIDNDNHGGSLLSQAFGGDAVLAMLLIICPMVAFYVSTWEQYYTGELVLPPFNGPSEGLVMGASLSIVSFFLGPMVWHGTGIVDGGIEWMQRSSLLGDTATVAAAGDAMASMLRGRVRNLDLIVFSSVVALFREVVLKIIFVVRTHGWKTVRTLLPHFVLVGCTFLLLDEDPTLLLRRPRTVMHLISGLFVEQTTQLMLDHMVEEDFGLFKRWSLMPLVVLVGGMMVHGRRTNGGDASGVALSVDAMDAIVLAYTTGLWVYLAFKIRVAVYEICDVLGIWCFDIVTPHPNNQKGCELEKERIVGTTVGLDVKKIN